MRWQSEGEERMIQLKEASNGDRILLWNLHQKYLYEMTNYYDNEMDVEGNYHYGYFDAYFTESERTAFLIYSDGRLAGFAMVNPYSYIGEAPDHVLAEFTIFPAFRKKHIGLEAARMIFGSFPGRWELKYNEKNAGAKRLWNRATEAYHPVRHTYSEDETVLALETENE